MGASHQFICVGLPREPVSIPCMPVEVKDLVGKGVLLSEIISSTRYTVEVRGEALDRMRANVLNLRYGST